MGRCRVPDHGCHGAARACPRSPRGGLQLGSGADAEAGLIKGERIGRCLDHGGQRGAEHRDNGEGYGRCWSAWPGTGLRRRTWRVWSGSARARSFRLGFEERPRPRSKRHDASGLQVDLDTGAVVAAELHPADEGDTTTVEGRGKPRGGGRTGRRTRPNASPTKVIGAVLRALNDSPWKTRIAAPKQTGFSGHGDEAARRAVTNNRSSPGSPARPSSCAPRSSSCFAHNLDRGGMRRTWLRGRENVHKRYLLHVAGHNLSLLMRQLIGAGTPREAVAAGYGGIFVLLTPTGAMLHGGSRKAARRLSPAAFLIWSESRHLINAVEGGSDVEPGG